jgi:hypothetical protein
MLQTSNAGCHICNPQRGHPAVSLVLVQPAVVKEDMLIHSILPKKSNTVEANRPQRSSHEQAKPIDYRNY